MSVKGAGNPFPASLQRLIFDLLHRALRDENLLEVLDKVAGLSTHDVAQFRELLERTTLQSIIRMASEVTERLTFLDVLQQILYGEAYVHAAPYSIVLGYGQRGLVCV